MDDASDGPDFSDIDSQAKAQAAFRAGRVERCLLLPAKLGGADIPQNMVYVPMGIARIKAGIDDNVITPLVAQGKVTQYTATPEYQGNSFIPIAIQVIASSPGNFTTTINIWGDALKRKS
jgi:hypothetical protein